MKMEPHLETLLPQLELRVLHGPQAGSRLMLSVGDYVLGTDDECEVMLAGPRMAVMHAKLRFDGDQPSISPMDGPVLDSQGNEISGEFPLALGMPVELGGIWITVDEVDSPWPSTEALIPSPSPHPESSAAEDNSPMSPDTQIPIPAMTRDDEVQRRKALRLLSASMASLLALAIVGIVAALWLAGDAGNEVRKIAQPTAEDARAKELRQQLAKALPGRQMTVMTRAGGMPIITAYVADTAMANQLAELVRKHAGNAAMVVYVDTDLLERARILVLQFQGDGSRAMIEVQAVSNGIASIRGAVASTGTRDEVFDLLRGGVPGLRGFDATLKTADDLPALLTDRIASVGLAKKLQVVSEQPEFVLRGTLTDEDLQRWEALLVQFTTEFGRLLPIRATLAQLQRRPPVEIRTVIGGAMPFIVTAAGTRIGPGGNANGQTLLVVRDNEVIFDGAPRYRMPR